MSKYFALIHGKEVHKGEGGKVIPSEEFSTLLQAIDLLEKVQLEAKDYLDQNKKKCKQFLEKAKQSGFNQGLTEFNKYILYYEKKLREYEHKFQQTLLPLVLETAKKVVGEELSVKPEKIIYIIRQHLKPVLQARQVKIHVSRGEREVVEKHKSAIQEILEQVQMLTIEESEEISSGGCIIETEGGTINATWESQWDAMKTAFEAFTTPEQPKHELS